MKLVLTAIATLALFVAWNAVLAGPTSMWDIDYARMAKKIEIQVDKSGAYREVEFHLDPSQVPAAVRDAMMKMHPNGKLTGAEVETEGGIVYFELTSTSAEGLESETMFLPDGTLHSEENQVPADKVPASVKDGVMAKFPGCTINAYEEIRNDERQLVEWHVKLVREGHHVKVMVALNGAVKAAVLEIPAEIEVPILVR
ncbi:MAG: hypothetical protein KDB73_19175 [Planctomycetes bacterium]|nr:hypothetical protein [Planctomycetota bacterium]